jgi:hypothetical protein
MESVVKKASQIERVVFYEGTKYTEHRKVRGGYWLEITSS